LLTHFANATGIFLSVLPQEKLFHCRVSLEKWVSGCGKNEKWVLAEPVDQAESDGSGSQAGQDMGTGAHLPAAVG
jgi:hypothetical protein